jgi:cytoskeletal protein CcmA (bactofilin family)
MFEIGKKEGSVKNESGTSNQNQQQGYSGADSTRQTASGAQREVAVIGKSIRIDGDLQGEEDLRIDGDVKGTVRLHNNTLTVGSEGKIRANVYAKSVAVDGVVEGDLYGSERIHIRKNARVLGNIASPRVSLEDGAQFKGSIEMDPDAVAKALDQAGRPAGKKLSAEPAKQPKPKPSLGNGAEKVESIN